MTGNIREMLSASEVSESLRMETKVAELLRSNGWKADTNVYFTDTKTAKSREIDAHGYHTIRDDSPERKGTNAPMVIMSALFECKSMAGSNLIVKSDLPPASHYGLERYWLGNEKYLRKLHHAISELTNLGSIEQRRTLYKILVACAYDDIPLEAKSTRIYPPEVDAVARSFRETTSGKLSRDEKNERNDSVEVSVLWRAVQALFSAAESKKHMVEQTRIEDVIDNDASYYGKNSEIAKYIGFFLGAELNRNTYIHRVVVTKAKIWLLTDDAVEEIGSCRLFFDNLDGTSHYTDVVSEPSMEVYIKNLCATLEMAAKSVVEKQWRTIEEQNWSANWATKRLRKLLRRRDAANK